MVVGVKEKKSYKVIWYNCIVKKNYCELYVYLNMFGI